MIYHFLLLSGRKSLLHKLWTAGCCVAGAGDRQTAWRMGRTWILSMASIPSVAKASQKVPQGLEGHQTRHCSVEQRGAKGKPALREMLLQQGNSWGHSWLVSAYPRIFQALPAAAMDLMVEDILFQKHVANTKPKLALKSHGVHSRHMDSFWRCFQYNLPEYFAELLISVMERIWTFGTLLLVP